MSGEYDGDRYQELLGRGLQCDYALLQAKYEWAVDHQAVLPGGVWMSYGYDQSERPTPFATEIEALRYAVDNSEHVRFFKFGETVQP